MKQNQKFSEVEKAYNILAEKYHYLRIDKKTGGWFYNEYLEMPTTLRMLGNVKKKKILDMGCGSGLYVKRLIARGAIVRGIDISEELIKLAKKEIPNIDFIVGNAENLPYKNLEFDIVLAALVMGHFASWDKVLKEVKRVLKKNGIFVFSTYNPVSEKSVKIKWFFRKFRVIKDYFEEGWRYANWTQDVKGAHHHKTYGTIVKLLLKNGFEIIDYEDCKPLSSAKNIFPKQYEKTINLPHFCVWKVKKKY